MIQKSYEKTKEGKLFLIPTPIGNLDDITYRAIKTLKEVDIIYAEDTRETLGLLMHLNINKKVFSCHKYSESMHKEKIINLLLSGKNIGYVTDRGTPLISDPGNYIVNFAIENNITVISLPGPNALLPALNMSGLSNERFLFYGFLSNKTNLAKKQLLKLKNIEETLIFYESPHRIKNTLEIIYEIIGNRKIAIVREISKLYEEVIRDNISNVIKNYESLKGEIVIVVEGNNNIEDNTDYFKIIDSLIMNGYTKSDAIKKVAKDYNVSKNKLYNNYKEK